MSIVFFTGFPGFLGSELVPRVLQNSAASQAVCLVQSKFMGEARSALAHIEYACPRLSGRIDLAVGDITAPGLGLKDISRIKKHTSEVFHLAAVYDLSVSRDLAMQVNLVGTRNVLDFAEDSAGLRRLHHMSTCYVSGRYAGIFSENDFDKGKAFNNLYEETKYLAEAEVRARMRGGLPVTIYRPSIVAGDSRKS